MIKMRKLQLRTISLILTLTILAGCVYSSAAADAVTSDHVDRQNGNLVERVYDSGNVTLSNQVKAEKNRIFTIKLNVKIKDIAKLSSQEDSVDTVSSTASSSVSSAVESTTPSAPVSSAPESAVTSAPASSGPESSVTSTSVSSDANSSVVSDSTSASAESTATTTSSVPAAEVQPSAARTMLARAVAMPQPEATYEVRYYIQPGFEVVESSIPKTASLEDGQYVSWSNLTAAGVSAFSTNLQLQAVAAEDGSDTTAENTEDQSGVYQAGEPVYLFAQSALQSVAQLPPIMEKTATLSSSADSWNTRTYDINLSVTARSQLVTSTTPCDIILVLDRSGSMADPLYTYSPIVGNPSTEDDSPDYYIALNGGYQKISYDSGDQIWYYWNSEQHAYYEVVPMSSGTDQYKKATYIDTDVTYYIHIGEAYYEVNYYDPGRHYSTAWYYTVPGGSPTLVTDTNLLLSQVYQFYTLNSQTKLQALKAAANQFVTNVATNSPDSRIGVVSFSSDYESYQEVTNNTNGLITVDGTGATTINEAINSLSSGGGTHAYKGMEMARSIFGADSVSPTGRKRVVIMFTDGEPGDQGFNNTNGYKAAASTINQSAILKANLGVQTTSNVSFSGYSGASVSGEGCGASVYSIGVFSGLSSDRLTLVGNYMKAVASFKPNSSTEKQYYPASDSTALNNIFDSISNEVGNIASATVTDEIDPRFELTAASRSALLADPKVTIVGNTITWSNQPINVLKDAQGNPIPSWTKSFSIQAKAQFIGGNNIPTNVQATSGVTYGSSHFVEFPQPTVNVKAEFNVGNAENTIFNGEAVPTTILGKYKVMGQDLFCGVGATGTFSYQWLKADGTTPIAAIEAFPADSQFPADSTSYTLRTSFDPGNPTTDSTANTDGHVAGETVSNPGVKGPASATGQYTVHVVKGQLNLSKTITAKYPAPDSVLANQSFVFKIQRYATLNDFNNQTNPETSYEVISLSGNTLNGSKTITGLKKGYYTVTEQTGDAWRYSQTGIIDNDSSVGTTTDGKIFIGRETTVGDAPKSYFGAGANDCGVVVNPATVGFTNRLDNHQWLGDTTVAVNTIRHAS